MAIWTNRAIVSDKEAFRESSVILMRNFPAVGLKGTVAASASQQQQGEEERGGNGSLNWALKQEATLVLSLLCFYRLDFLLTWPPPLPWLQSMLFMGWTSKIPWWQDTNGHCCVKSVMRKMCSVFVGLKYAFSCTEVCAREDLERFL